jgi:flagellar motor switch protein FliG
MTTSSTLEPRLQGLQKIAVLLVSLGEQASAELLRRLSDEELFLITQALTQLKTVNPEHAEAVLEEFYRGTITRSTVGVGGEHYTRRVLTSALGPEAAQKMVERLPSTPEKDACSTPLGKADPQELGRIIRGEHPQTIALVLSHLPQAQAAGLLASLSGPLRIDVVRRMARLDEISPAVVHKIITVISQKLTNSAQIQREACGGLRAVAEICNRIDPSLGDEILNGIAEQEESLADSIRELMFVFEDFINVPADGIKEIIARADRKVLMVALKGTSDELKVHFFQCMSQRGAEMFREDMEAAGAVKIKEVEGAQRQIIAAARQMEKSGVISLSRTGTEEYVS